RGLARLPEAEVSRTAFSNNCKSDGRNPMSLTGGVTRRDLFVKAGIFCNGIVGMILAVPIVRYLLSPVTRERKPGYDSWIPLGSLEQFPPGETRLATYRNPVVSASDGDTANIACWVRNVDG